MPKALQDLAREAMELTPQQRLTLADLLIESAHGTVDLEVEASWDEEIRRRIRAIDEGKASGVAWEDVMRDAVMGLE